MIVISRSRKFTFYMKVIRILIFIKSLKLNNSYKLVFHSLGKRTTFKDAFGFASNHLLQKKKTKNKKKRQ